jgi:hypothetical protein
LKAGRDLPFLTSGWGFPFSTTGFDSVSDNILWFSIFDNRQ